MLKKNLFLFILFVVKYGVSQNASTFSLPKYALSPATEYVDTNKDGIISLDEARVIFEKYQENISKHVTPDLLVDIESTVIELISYLEGINCDDIKRSIASNRFIEIYYANKFFDSNTNSFGFTPDTLKNNNQSPVSANNNIQKEKSSPIDKYISVGLQFTDIYQCPFGSTRSSNENLSPFTWTKENLLLLNIPIKITPWKGATFNFSPEYSAGRAVGNGIGLASYPNGIYGQSQSAPYFYRAQYQQIFNIDTAKNAKVKSLEVLLGRFVLQEAFNMNKYAFDPANDFLNFNHMMLSAWDAATTAYGYTHGVALRLNLKKSQINFAAVTVNKTPSALSVDWNIEQSYSLNLQYARKFDIGKRTGNVRVLGFYNKTYSGSYNNYVTDSITAKSYFPDSLKAYTGKYGFGLDIDFKLTDNLALFGRYSWNDGQSESMAFTQADESLAGGLSFALGKLKRPNDIFGLALSVNKISSSHKNYLQNGGSGFMLGDGSLNYKNENAFEAFFKTNILKYVDLTLDYQYILNSAYNSDKGNIHFWACRLNIEF